MTMKTPYLVAVLVLVPFLAGCGSGESSSDGGGAPLATGGVNQPIADDGDEPYELNWNRGDDADAIISEWEFQDLTFDIEDHEGLSLSTSEVDGCFVDSINPTGLITISRDDDFTVVVDCSQKYWDERTGTAWEEFAYAYASGFSEGCEDVFAISPSGSFYVDDWEYDSFDCSSGSEFDAELSDGVPTEVPDSPDIDGAALGAYDGCMNLFDEVGGALYYGNDGVDDSICGSDGAIDVGAAGTDTNVGFESPTGNIRCNYDGTYDSIACYVANRRQAVSLDANGTATLLGNAVIGRQNQVLPYGYVWTQSVFTCESSENGIMCVANVGNYAGYFAVSRDGIVSNSD